MTDSPMWSFTVRLANGRAVKRAGRLCWIGTGPTRADAAAQVRAAVAERVGVDGDELDVSPGLAENYAAEVADAKQ